MKLTRFQRPDLWPAFDQLTDLRDEINRLFDAPFGELTHSSEIFNVWGPELDMYKEKDNIIVKAELIQVNIIETKEGYVLEAEMPGVNKSGLEVLLEGNELTIVGRRSVGVPHAELLHRESSPRDFRRVFALDPAIDPAKINAKMENGILTLELPKAESVKPRKIAVSD